MRLMFAPARLRTFALLSCALIICFGLACRFYNLKWDKFAHIHPDEHFAHIHPDERFIVMTVAALKAPASLSEYFNSSISGLNPFHTSTDLFIYGQLPLNLCKAIAMNWPGRNKAPNCRQLRRCFNNWALSLGTFRCGHGFISRLARLEVRRCVAWLVQWCAAGRCAASCAAIAFFYG